MPGADTPSLYDRSFFESQEGSSHRSAVSVLGKVFHLLRPRRILDVGCGTGPWMRAALDLGAAEAIGIDGDYIDRRALLVDPDHFIAADLASQSVRAVLGAHADEPFDLAICVEVAEHLPFERALPLVADLTSSADAVLFSAAVPFQYGTHHVNEQWPEFWSILFRSHDFACFDCLRSELWAADGVDWWYAQNALLFARDGSRAAAALPEASRMDGRGLSLVHPENLLANLLSMPRRYRFEAWAEEPGDYRSLVAANLQRGSTLPPLAAPARAVAEGPQAAGVFPWTRTQIHDPESEIGRLSRTLAETGGWLAAANDAFEAERAKRLELERELRRHAELAERLQAQGAARMVAETRLRDLKAVSADRLRQADEDHQAELARIVAERETALAQTASLQSALTEEAAALSRRATELDQRSAEIDAVRRSRTWRLSRRILSLSGRLPRPPVQAAEPVILPTPDMEAEKAPPEPVAEKLPIKCYGKTLGKVNWWTLAAAITRLKRLEVFDADDYLRRNPDVQAAGADPYAHFIQSGALEDRGRVDQEDLARLMGSLALFDNAVRGLPEDIHDDSDLADLVADVGHVGIFVSSEGNMFMNDLADDLAADLRSAGVTVDVLDETVEIGTRPSVCLFVAPHEFFTLGRGTEWVRDDVLSEGFVFGTEQLQTSWFNTALPFTLMSRGMLDICSQTADLFARTDMAALHVLPGAQLRPHTLTERDRRHPLFGVLPAAAQRDIDPALPFASRPIDVCFFGTSSPRRDQFFAHHAGFFSDFETFNYCRRPGRGPIRGESEDGGLTRLAGHVCGHSKIALNIHREEFGYFEWHRMVRLGMSSGSLVVSDPCLPHPRFIANEHYFQETARQIPNLLEWLLRTEDGAREAERVRSNVDSLIKGQYGTRRSAAEILRFLSRHRSHEARLAG